jgi:hypothetical protein
MSTNFIRHQETNCVSYVILTEYTSLIRRIKSLVSAGWQDVKLIQLVIKMSSPPVL